MTRLMYDHSPAADDFYVKCLKCGGRVRLCDSIIDLDGPPFMAYYCAPCAPADAIEPCPLIGCRRWHREEDQPTDR
jgi:hypothetical protein